MLLGASLIVLSFLVVAVMVLKTGPWPETHRRADEMRTEGRSRIIVRARPPSAYSGPEPASFASTGGRVAPPA